MKFKKLTIALMATGLLLAGCGGNASGSGDTKVGGEPGKKADVSLTKDNFTTVMASSMKNAKTAQMDMKIAVPGGQSITATGQVSTGSSVNDTGMSMVMNMGGQKLEMRLLDQIFYMNMGKLTQNKFAKLDLKKDDNPLVKEFGGLMDEADPAKSLEQYKKALKTFKKVGSSKKIDGVKTTEYKLILDGSKMDGVDSLPAKDQKTVSDIPLTIFIGDDNLPRRMVTEIAGGKTQVDYTKWGKSVDIKAPADDQIVSSKTLEKLGQAS